MAVYTKLTENNLKDAIINLETIIDQYSDHILAADAQYLIADIYLNDIKDFDYAVDKFKKVIENHEW